MLQSHNIAKLIQKKWWKIAHLFSPNNIAKLIINLIVLSNFSIIPIVPFITVFISFCLPLTSLWVILISEPFAYFFTTQTGTTYLNIISHTKDENIKIDFTHNWIYLKPPLLEDYIHDCLNYIIDFTHYWKIIEAPCIQIF